MIGIVILLNFLKLIFFKIGMKWKVISLILWIELIFYLVEVGVVKIFSNREFFVFNVVII